MSTEEHLESTIVALTQEGKGILAADESNPTIAKRFEAIGVTSTEESRREYRNLILATPGLGEYISGVIFFEETLRQKADDGTPLPELAASQGIVPGIKVDTGKIPLANAPGDEITQGLDGLEQRLEAYYQQGARFAKWRNVFHISDYNPTTLDISINAETLARYAIICQSQGIVPIVEPEVLMDGNHSMERCAQVSEVVIREVFAALHRHGVLLECVILKPSMITPGKEHPRKASPGEVADQTLRSFRRVVPAAVPLIAFLSGGQSPEEATANLNALNTGKSQPWELSFSFGRALQEPAQKAWAGKAKNIKKAQQALLKRAHLNSAARSGTYTVSME